MTDESVYCLKCGYDLRGIPERRCPECGFGYDHAAIRYFSFYQNWDRDNAARRVIKLSAIVLALLISPLTWTYTWGGFERVLLVYAVWLAALLVVRLLSPHDPEGLLLTASPIELALKSLWVTPLPAMALSIFPILGLVAGTIVCVRGWFVYARAPERFAFAFRMQTEDRQRTLQAYGGVATSVLVVTTVLVMVGWLA